MIRNYQLTIPLPIDDCFALIRTCGRNIPTWSQNHIDTSQYYVDWKQSIWSFSGSAVITARLSRAKDGSTNVAVEIHRPFQLIDPFFVCDRIFRKLDKAVTRQLEKAAS